MGLGPSPNGEREFFMRYRPSDPPVFSFTTGPVEVYPDVLRALAQPVLFDGDPLFQAAYQRVGEKLHALVRSETVPVLLQGEAVLALEAAALGLLGPGDVLLNLVSGVYAKGFEPWARRAGAEVVELRVPFDRGIEPEAVAEVLKARPDVTVVAAVHHDTPSGTINPIDAIGAIVAAHGALFLVDAVSSFGGMAGDAASAKADAFVTGANKCLGCPPGLSILGLGRRAWVKMKENPAAPRGSMLSVLDWEDAWKAGEPFPFTPSVAEVNGLEAALDRHFGEGPERVVARHALTARAARDGVRAMGLQIWPAEERFAAPTATAVRVPDGIDAAALLAETRARYGVVLAPGRGETAGRLVRIGHMGPAAQPLHALAGVMALGGALKGLGRDVDLGAGAAAVMAAIDRAA